MLEVTVYETINEDEPVIYEDIDYVSLVSDETYGPPALIAPNRGSDLARARIGQTVLYLNTHYIPMFSIRRTSD
jgi:hypothetical protein